MAIEIPDLSIYTICQLADGTELKMPEMMYSYGPDQVRITMFPEDRTLEDFEAILQNIKNTHRIQILNRTKDFIHATLIGYTTLLNLEKKYKEAYRKEYDENGNETIYTTDLFIAELRKPTLEDKLPQYQSDLEYVAIMSGIDLNTDEE